MTPPAEQSAVHDEEAGAAQGPRGKVDASRDAGPGTRPGPPPTDPPGESSTEPAAEGSAGGGAEAEGPASDGKPSGGKPSTGRASGGKASGGKSPGGGRKNSGSGGGSGVGKGKGTGGKGRGSGRGRGKSAASSGSGESSESAEAGSSGASVEFDTAASDAVSEAASKAPEGSGWSDWFDRPDRPDDTEATDAPDEPADADEADERAERAGRAERAAAERDLARGGLEVRRGELIRALNALRDQIAVLDFMLDVPGVQQAREAQLELRNQLDDYVLPRIQAAGTPMLVVLGGSTGAGKSTLVNTLVGARVSATGVLRPTTSSPILVCHPDHADWFLEGPMLPGMGRVRGPAPDAIAGDQLVVIGTDALPPGLALLDSPDFDSVFEDHYEFATKLMAAADLWLCVTTAARYADAQVWEMLRRAKENGATIGVVLSRVPDGAGGEIVDHFGEMLAEHDVGEARRFTVPETRVEDSRLPEEAVEHIREWLVDIASDADDRTIIIGDTLAAVLNSFRTRVPELAKQVELQVEQRAELANEVDAAYGTALAELDEATRNGSLLRGEVLARWQDFAGTGDLLRALHRARGRPSRRASGRRSSPARVRALKAALRSALESLIASSAEHAAEQVIVRWREHPAGRQVLAGPAADLGHTSPELSRRITRTVSAWQDHVQELIRTEGVTKRSVAKLVSFDSEAVSLVLMVGLLGYGTSDVAVEGGTSAVPQRLLKALFGAESLRGMGAKARADLRSRIGMLFDEESIRYGQAIDAAGIPDETVPVQLYQATYNLEVAR